MEIKDYNQFLAEGGEIRHTVTGIKVKDAFQWGSDGKWCFRYDNGRVEDWNDPENWHTFRAPRERVSTPILVWDDGYISFAHSSNASHEIITEKQEDGSWKIIETILKPNA